ncbi:MAG: hypothetical protein JNK41_08975 [Saprospiraceae bacterium]|jgi:hypothetical protein|nr:hypothetical protein [Saprospiraceae bacterium]
MKKLIFVVALLGVFSLGANAQACCAKKSGAACTKTASASTATPDDAAIATLASNDASIEKRKDEATGASYYVRKEVCEKSGKVSYNKVEYCSKEGKFVNVSPSDASGSAKSCCTSKASCSKNSAAGACCAKKGASADAAVKTVSNDNK